MSQDNSYVNKLTENKEGLPKNDWEILTVRIKEILKEATKRTGQLTYNTEEEFLLIGQNLQNYYKSAKEITGTIADVTGVISEEILKNGIHQLNIFLAKIKDYLNLSAADIESGETSLSEILSVLSNVVEDLSGFKRIVKHLRMLGISTRIESARLSHDDAGFTALAENVEKLSGIINDKASNIKERANHLGQIINETISRIINLENKQNEQANFTLGSITGNLSGLNKKYFIYSEKAGVISSRSTEISQDISRIVTSIQFHDITRQQIEHVEQALVLVGQKAEVNENLCDGEEAHSKLQEQLIYIHNVCKLQSLQLKHTKNELFTAVNSIINSLNNVRENIIAVFYEAQSIITDGTKSEGSNTIKEIESGFSEISKSLTENSNIRIELTNSMKGVTDTIRNLARYIDEIDEIGSEIELIALNSSIKAAHTGSEGAALGVLAVSIQRLSIDSKEQTKLVSETLRKISDASEKLYTNIEYNSDDRNFLELSSISTEITAQLNNLTKHDKETFRTLSGVKDSFEKLNEEIIQSISKISVHNTSAEVIDLLVNGLDEIVYLISRNIDNELLNRQEDLNELNYQYTMNSERNVHNSFLNLENTENMQQESAKGQIPEDSDNSNADSEDFGDNVELF